MASYDAEIRVRTSIDNSKFDKGAEGIQHSLNEIEKGIDRAKGQLKDLEDLGLPKTSQIYRSAAADLKKWNAELESVKKKQIETSSDFSEHMNQMRVEVEEYANTLKQLEKEGQYFGDADYDEVYLVWKNAVDEVKKYQAELNKQTKKGQADEAEKTARALERQEAAQRRIEAQAEKNLQTENARIQKEAEKQAKLQAEAAEEQRLAQIKANATVSDQKMVDLLERRKQLQAEIRELEQAGVTAGYREYDARQAELKTINTRVSGSADMGGTITQLTAIAGKVSKIAAVVGVILTAVKTVGSVVKGIASTITKITLTIVRTVGSAVKKIVSGFKTLATQAGKLFSKLTSGFRKSERSAGGFLDRLLGLVKSVFVFNVISKAFQDMVTGMQDSLKKYTQYSSEFNTNVSSLVNSLNTLKNALSGAFAPILSTVIPYLIQLINYVTQAVNVMSQLIAALTGKSTWSKAVQQNKDYAASLDGVTGSAKKAQGALAKFDDLDVLQRQDSPGGSGGAEVGGDLWEEVPISDSVKGLADWLREMWENTDFYDLGKLLGEKLKDALDNIPWDGIKESARKIGKSIASLINGFIEVEGLGESIGRTLAEALNTAFGFLNAFVHELHWDSLGKFIAETISGFFNNIDWPLIYDSFITGAQGLADAINSFVNNFDWDTVSTTVGNIVNTFVDTIYTFFAGVDWGKLGELIGQQISAAINSINFTSIGNALSMALISLLTLFLEIIDNIEWRQIGTRFATAIVAIDWDGLSSTLFNLIVSAINSAVDFVGSFILSIDWGEIAGTLGRNLSTALKGFDWTGAGKAFGTGINALVDIILSFISGLDITGIAEGLGQWVNGAIEKIDAEKLGDAIEGVVDTVLDLLIGFMEEVDWAQVGDKIEEAFTSIDGGQIAAKIGEALKLAFSAVIAALPEWVKNVGSSIIDGIGAGLLSGEGLLQTISGALFMGLITFIKELLGIHSPSTVFQEIGGNLIEGLLLGIQETWLLLQEWFVTTFETLILFFTEKWTAIKDGAAEIWTLLKDTLAEIWTNIQDKATEVFDAVKDKLSEVWDSIKLKIDTKVKEIKTEVDELLKKFTDLKNDATEAFNKVKTNIINALTPVIEKIQSFIDIVRNAIQAVKDLFSSGYDQVGSSAAKTSKASSRSNVLAMAMQEVGTPSLVDAQSVVSNIPHLASGAVIQGGNPFLAVLGDQRAGQTNIEAPLSTIRQAVRDELSGLGFGGGQMKVVLQVNGVDLAQATLQDFLSEMSRQGLDVEVLGVT